jgi:hypothetical protein
MGATHLGTKNEIHPFFFMLVPHKGCRSEATAILAESQSLKIYRISRQKSNID